MIKVLNEILNKIPLNKKLNKLLVLSFIYFSYIGFDPFCLAAEKLIPHNPDATIDFTHKSLRYYFSYYDKNEIPSADFHLDQIIQKKEDEYQSSIWIHFKNTHQSDNDASFYLFIRCETKKEAALLLPILQNKKYVLHLETRDLETSHLMTYFSPKNVKIRDRSTQRPLLNKNNDPLTLQNLIDDAIKAQKKEEKMKKAIEQKKEEIEQERLKKIKKEQKEFRRQEFIILDRQRQEERKKRWEKPHIPLLKNILSLFPNLTSQPKRTATDATDKDPKVFFMLIPKDISEDLVILEGSTNATTVAEPPHENIDNP